MKLYSPTYSNIEHSLQSVAGSYYRLVLVVGNAGSGKTTLLRGAAKQLRTSVVNVSLKLSSRLLELTAKQRVLRLPEIFGEIVAPGPKSPVVLDNLEMLFGESLKQDPLRLLQNASRNNTVVAAWNGTMVDDRLLYAEPGHPEYRSYAAVDALVVTMDDASAADSAQS